MHVVLDGRPLEDVVEFGLDVATIDVTTMGSLPKFIDGPKTFWVRYENGRTDHMSGHDVVHRDGAVHVYVETVSPEREAEQKAATVRAEQRKHQAAIDAAARAQLGIWGDHERLPTLPRHDTLWSAHYMEHHVAGVELCDSRQEAESYLDHGEEWGLLFAVGVLAPALLLDDDGMMRVV